MAKRAAIWAGRLVALLSLFYLAWAVSQHWQALGAWRPDGGVLTWVAALSLLYGVALLLVGEAWHQLVASFAGRPIDRSSAIASFGVTQIAKYLPGNVFHYVGRHLWLSRSGVPHQALAKAALWELLLLAGAALGVASVAALASDAAPLPAFGFPLWDWAAIVLAFAAGALAAVLAGWTVSPLLRSVTPPPQRLLQAILLLALFFALQGSTFAALFVAVDTEPVLLAIAIACLSWVAGFLTPGAPGGIGSRELVLTTLAAPLVGTAPALILSALFRLVTTLGDVVCFAISRWWLAPAPDPADG